MNEFGEPLADLRQFHNLTQKQLADKIKVSVTTISNYENGHKFPSYEVMIEIAKSFSVSLDYLCGLPRNEVPYSRENYIVLPREKTNEIRKEMLNHLTLLKSNIM